MTNKIIISQTNDPAYNLGLEEYLISQGDNILYLWQNQDTIVIGRNQNPYKECNIEKIEEDKINLMRRRSGGGAVFHDLGNLNFTLISKKNDNNIEENFKLVNKALAYEGIKSVFNGRNDLDVDGRKISGNAFFEEDNIFCHHGTLLIDVDMTKLSTYLTASKLKLESKGIKSVKSRVINLVDIKPDIGVDSIINSFIKAYGEEYKSSKIEYYNKARIEENLEIMEKVSRYQSWEWVYGESPKSNLTFEEKFDWGIVEFNLNIESGFIKEAKIYTDSIINDNFTSLSEDLLGKNFRKAQILDGIERNIRDKKLRKDLKSMKDIKNIK